MEEHDNTSTISEWERERESSQPCNFVPPPTPTSSCCGKSSSRHRMKASFDIRRRRGPRGAFRLFRRLFPPEEKSHEMLFRLVDMDSLVSFFLSFGGGGICSFLPSRDSCFGLVRSLERLPPSPSLPLPRGAPSRRACMHAWQTREQIAP